MTALVTRLRAAGCVFAEDEALVLESSASSADDLERMVTLRVGGLPLEHVVGWAQFCGLRILVSPGVFVPRPRTAFLVEQARRRVRDDSIVLDLCCGTGAIGRAVTRATGARLVATDIDAAAVADARRNVEPAGGEVYGGDLFGPLPSDLRARVTVMTVIAPYVPTRDIALLPHEARDFEPLIALDGGADGLDLVRRILAEAPEWLAPGGSLFTEVSEAQVPVVVELANAVGLWVDVWADDEAYCWVVEATRT